MQRRHLGALVLALAAGAAAHAQSSITTGSIRGTVIDGSGRPLAGARVILTSAQVTRTMTTGADGSFRVGLLNPGSWEVKVSKENFQTQSGSVMVAPNDNRTLNFKLAPLAAATVEVSAAEPVVDTTSVTVGQNYSLDQIASIPKARDFSGVALFTPGVADGGFRSNSPSMSGASAAENTYYVDGLDTTDYRYGFQGAQLKTDFIDQVSVQTGGFAPEFSALGGVFNAITKSGTNDVQGSAWLTWDAAGIHAVLKQNKYFVEPNLDADNRYDIGGEVSGPLIKDKLFYFVGVDAENRKGISTTNGIGLQNDRPTNKALQTVAKVNWFINPDMQLTYFGNYNRTKLDTGNLYTDPVNGPYGTEQAGYSQTDTITSSNLSYDWTITPSLTLSVKAGFFQLDTKQDPLDTTDNQSLDFHWYDASGPNPDPTLAGNSFNVGGFGVYTQDEKNKTSQYNAALTWVVGNHNVKAGASYLKSEYTLAQIGSGLGGYQYQISADGTRLDAILFINLPATVTAYYKGLFLQDNWEALPGFRMIYGFRYEGQSQNDYRGVQIFNFSRLNQSIQPRFGFTWDVNNDGKTKVSGSWARYFEHFPQRAAIRTWGRETYIDQVYTGANWAYDTTSPTHVRILAAPSSIQDYSTAFNQDPIAQGVRLPQRDEVALGVDHQFASGWTLGLHGEHRELKNPVEDSVILSNPGTAGQAPVNADGHAIWWNPGSSVTWTQTYVSPDAGTTYTVNNTGFPKAGNTYDAITFTADLRTSRDYVSFNYTWSRLQGNYEGLVSSSNGQADANITASMDSWAYQGWGLLPLDRTNVVKLQYSHRFTLPGGDMNLGANYSYTSGTPISLFDDGSTSQGLPPGTLGAGNIYDPFGYGNSTPANGQLGQYGRTPSVQQVDMHLDYTLNLGGKKRLAPSVDIFNLFNTRPATGIFQLATIQYSGAPDVRYGAESSWLEGRRFRFGIKYQF